MGGVFLLSDRLGPATTANELAVMLGTSYAKIKYFYYSRPIGDCYKQFSIPKKNGGKRLILAPDDKLKTLQTRLAIRLAEIYTPRKGVTGFIPGSNIAKNAKLHSRSKYVFNIDLEDFFPSVKFYRIRGLLTAQPYSLMPETATVIAHLCTLNGSLPQGAPTSPILSNMFCASMDRLLYSLAVKFKATYSRYADDISFSFKCPLRFLPEDIVKVSSRQGELSNYRAELGSALAVIIADFGFSENKKKTRLLSRSEKQIVTGLVVNTKANVDRRYIRKTAAMIHSLEQVGEEVSNERRAEKNPGSTTPLAAHVQGRLLFIHQVLGKTSPVYARLSNRFNVLPLKYKVPSSMVLTSEREASIAVNKFVRSKCWVVEVAIDIPGDCIISQGSGFMISKNILVTCAHVLEEKGVRVNECEIYQVDNDAIRHQAEVLFQDFNTDIAVLKLLDFQVDEFFHLEEGEEPSIGDPVVVLGFPNVKNGAKVGVMRAQVTNKYPLFKPPVMHSEVDKMLYPGNSGGPVINARQHVVGIAAKGAAGSAEGQNSFIRVSELSKLLAANKPA